MTSNQQTVERYMDGFRRSDRARILDCVTDDVEWEIPGAFRVRGREAFAGHIVDPGFEERPEITVARFVVEGNVVVAEGRVRTARVDGTVLHLAFCDVFELRGGRIARLTSYLVPLNAQA